MMAGLLRGVEFVPLKIKNRHYNSWSPEIEWARIGCYSERNEDEGKEIRAGGRQGRGSAWAKRWHRKGEDWEETDHHKRRGGEGDKVLRNRVSDQNRTKGRVGKQ